MWREAGLRLELFALDMEASIAFYTLVLAFELARHEPGDYASLRLGGVVLGIGSVAKLPEEQKTNEPRSEDDPDNLYAPIRGHDTARDGFRALSRSLYNWLQMHPVVRRGAAVGTALGLMAALRRRS